LAFDNTTISQANFSESNGTAETHDRRELSADGQLQ